MLMAIWIGDRPVQQVAFDHYQIFSAVQNPLPFVDQSLCFDDVGIPCVLLAADVQAVMLFVCFELCFIGLYLSVTFVWSHWSIVKNNGWMYVTCSV